MMNMDDIRRAYRVAPGYWFAPKLFGYGATPVTWQGWAVTLAGSLLLVAIAMLVEPIGLKVALGTIVLVGLLALCLAKTDGGWHWRWGYRA